MVQVERAQRPKTQQQRNPYPVQNHQRSELTEPRAGVQESGSVYQAGVKGTKNQSEKMLEGTAKKEERTDMGNDMINLTEGKTERSRK